MTVRDRLLAFLLLPLLAVGVGGLRFGHVAIAHGDADATTKTACSHRHHGPCGHSHGPVAAIDLIDADEADDSGPPPSDHDDCLDCDLLAVMLGGATPEAPAPLAATPSLDRPIEREFVAAIRASEAHRARPPPVA